MVLIGNDESQMCRGVEITDLEVLLVCKKKSLRQNLAGRKISLVEIYT